MGLYVSLRSTTALQNRIFEGFLPFVTCGNAGYSRSSVLDLRKPDDVNMVAP